MRIQALMQSPVITLDADASLAHAQVLMQRQGISHLPVLQGKKLVGMVTSHVLRHFEPSIISSASNEPPGAVACLQVRDVMTQRFMRLTPVTAPCTIQVLHVYRPMTIRPPAGQISRPLCHHARPCL